MQNLAVLRNANQLKLFLMVKASFSIRFLNAHRAAVAVSCLPFPLPSHWTGKL